MEIKIFTTGGTIDKVYFDAKSEFQVGDPQIEKILRDLDVAITFDVETLFSKDSLDITDSDRESIRRHVEASPSRRVLITHGTDTMIQTGRILRDVRGKVIVLVGSLSPARFKGSDAEFNIGFALAAAQLLPDGVYIAMNGKIFDPEHARKNRERNRFEVN